MLSEYGVYIHYQNHYLFSFVLCSLFILVEERLSSCRSILKISEASLTVSPRHFTLSVVDSASSTTLAFSFASTFSFPTLLLHSIRNLWLLQGSVCLESLCSLWPHFQIHLLSPAVLMTHLCLKTIYGSSSYFLINPQLSFKTRLES